MKRIIVLGVILAASLLLPAFAAEKVEFRATVGDDGVQRVEIVGGEYFYRPNHIIVKVNVPVELKVTNDSRFVPHSIKVTAPEAGIDFSTDLKREPKLIRFTPKKVGIYPMYCDKKLLFFASHREKGMEGAIEVIE